MMKNNSEDKVYQEWNSRLVRSSQGSNRYYRIFYGTVMWKDKELRKACVVFIQYGSSLEWKQACKNREIAFNEPAHILVEDYESINSAIRELTRED